MGRNVARIKREIQIIEKLYTGVQWSKEYAWVKLCGFNLSEQFKPRQCDLLIMIADGYGYGVPLDGEVYASRGLRVLRDGIEKVPHHYYENGGSLNRFSQSGWAWLSFHPTWLPEDNLLTYLKQLELFMIDLTREEL